MSYLPYIALGFLPSIVWLIFYLREDVHPESNKMIIAVFFLGMAAIAPVFLVEFIADFWFKMFPYAPYLLFTLLGIGFTEEIFKYLVVRLAVLRNKEFDEPIDAMLYLIIAALGFAAVENIIVVLPIFGAGNILSFNQSLLLSFLRFIGATLLHTLSSGMLGYFLAMSFAKKHLKNKLLLAGIFSASIFHTLYNFGIMIMEDKPEIAWPFIALLLAAGSIIVTLLFQRLKKMSSVCK